MTRNILPYGLLAGGIITLQMVLMVQMCYGNPNFEPSAIVGFGTMILAFSLVFIGILNYRNKIGNGFISFGKALKIGAGIAFVASTIYVVTWLFYFYLFVPDFMEKYGQMVLNQAAKNGATAADLAAKTQETQEFAKWYKNPLFVILMTYAEVLPVGLLVTLFSAIILKRKPGSLPLE